MKDLTKNLFQNVQFSFLHNNNNEFYNQIEGTAMGTIFAPTYTTLSMGYFEIKLYSACTFKHEELLAEYIKENQNHFLHDCYTVLRSSQISLEELLLTLNSINPSIQFTTEDFNDQIPFLGILIRRNENGIQMDLYHKATATERCLPFKSSHQNVLKNNNVSGFHNIRLIQSNSDERCECCQYLLINDHYTFKNVQIKNPLLN